MRPPSPQEGWRRLRSAPTGRDYPKSFPLAVSDSLPESIEFPSPVSVLFGLNGAGKSRILSALAQADGGLEVFALSDLALYLRNDFGQRGDLQYFLDEIDPMHIDGDVVQAVSDLVRRDYTAVRWYMVEISDSPFAAFVDDDVVPFFQVEYGGISYDFRTMGLGEISAHLLIWLYTYYEKNQKSAILLDEPEAFLPAPSRDVVLSYVLSLSLRREVPTFIASHSIELIEPALANNAALLVHEKDNEVSVLGPSADLHGHVEGIYGIVSSVDRILFCEDESAISLAREIVRSQAPDMLAKCAFLWCKGYGNVVGAWRHLPMPSNMPPGLNRLFFIADGDKSDDVEREWRSKSRDFDHWPLFCLPGDPDELFKAAAQEAVSELSVKFEMTEASLSGRLYALRGREVHEWVKGVVAATTVVGRPMTLRALARSAVARLERDEPGTLEAFIQALR